MLSKFLFIAASCFCAMYHMFADLLFYDGVAYHAIIFWIIVAAQIGGRDNHWLSRCHFISTSCFCAIYHVFIDFLCDDSGSFLLSIHVVEHGHELGWMYACEVSL